MILYIFNWIAIYNKPFTIPFQAHSFTKTNKYESKDLKRSAIGSCNNC